MDIAFKVILFLTLLLTQNQIAAISTPQDNKPNDIPIEKETFGTSALTQLDILNTRLIHLSVEIPTESSLLNAVEELGELRDKAETCIKETQKETAELTSIVSPKSETPNSTQDDSDFAKHIAAKKNTLNEKLANCKLISLRSNKAIKAFRDKANDLASRKLLQSKSSALATLVDAHTLPGIIHNNFDLNVFIQHIGFLSITNTQLLLLFFLICLGYFAGIKARRTIKHRIGQINKEIDTTPSILYQPFLCAIQKYEIYLLQWILVSGFLTILHLSFLQLEVLTQISYACTLYVFFIVILHLLFSPPPPGKPFIQTPEDIKQPLIRRLKFFGITLLFGYITYLCLQNQPFPNPAIQLPITIFISILAITFMSVLWLINRTKLLQATFNLHVFISVLFSILLLTIIISGWVGYFYLSVYLLSGITLSSLFVMLAWSLHKLAAHILNSLSGNEAPWQKQARKHLGLKDTAAIPELIWFRLVIYILIWGGFVLLLLRTWWPSEVSFHIFSEAILEGFTIAGFEIIPSRIISAFLVFSFFILLTRFLKSALARSKGILSENRGARQAFATILGYVGFTIALFVSLLLAGINFSGLTLIFGALSVGIGFGLQNIVNNFVSGLILLIERPIKVGDRIILSGLEGHVKKISIRATQIRSLDFFDVIVPNSELISGRVTNLMFRDFIGRITLSVGVAYDSNIELVKQTLLDVVYNHEETIPDRAEVLLKEFGDNSINFDIRFVVRDIDKRIQIASDINYAIDRAFRENKITIPFPQRDIHIPSGLQLKKTQE